MAYTAHKDAEYMEELYDSEEVLEAKIDQVVDMIREFNKF